MKKKILGQRKLNILSILLLIFFKMVDILFILLFGTRYFLVFSTYKYQLSKILYNITIDA